MDGKSRYVQTVRRLRLRHIELLRVLGEQCTLSAAATELSLSQSAVSKMLGEIERELGATLFHRSKRGVILSAEGEVAVRGARVLLNDLAALSEKVEMVHSGASDLLRIGTFSTVALLPFGLAALHRQFPNLKSRLVEGIAGDLIKRLLAGEIDCVVGSLPPDALSQAEIGELEFDVIAEDRLCVMAAPSHRLRGSRRLTLHQLSEERWVLPLEGTLLRSTFIASFLRENLRPPSADIESTSPVTMRWLVRADSERLGVMRWQQAREEIADGYLCMLALTSSPQLSPVALIYRKNVMGYGQILEDFKRVLIQEVRSLDASAKRRHVRKAG
ncbi:LysR family transcriptional regulator [Paraburkholderia sp. BCC1884]|uniref:LysR family transcriptional regulator n=1 Tax=Paraburkholderia sp. BCC1884 TaxID=2562668 RepID=UPI0011832465|nr:LysR family transcriptional regulator [Paraburkholderia sp. BCC1884]